MPKISVIVPVYNAELFIVDCIESILAQSYTEFELLLIDDGSKDKSGMICDAYAEKDPRVRVIHKENGGVSSARNLGLSIANGEYVTFVDSDDWIASTFLGQAYLKCKSMSADVYIAGWYKAYKHCNYRKNVIEKCIFRRSDALNSIDLIELFDKSYIGSVWGKLYCKEAIGDIRFNERMNFGEDLEFIIRLMKKSLVLYADTSPAYYYRATEHSLSTYISKQKCYSVVKTYRTIYEYFYEQKSGTDSLIAFADKRWLKDLLDFQAIILKEKCSLLKKYEYLTILNEDRMLRNRLRLQKDAYIERYGIHPLILLMRWVYKEKLNG